MKPTCAQVTQSEEVLGGAPVFRGTRAPVRSLLDYLEAGDNIETFLEDYPTVSKDQVIAVFEFAKSIINGAIDEAAA